MKTISIYYLLVAITLSCLVACKLANASSNANSYSFNKLIASLCETAKNDQLFHLRSNLRKARHHIRTIYPEIKCDGVSLLSIAMENQADSVIKYLKLKAQPEILSVQSEIRTANNPADKMN